MCKYKLKSAADKGTYFCLYYRASDVEPCPPRCFHSTEDAPGVLEEVAARHELRCVYLEVAMAMGSRILTCAVDGTVDPECRNCPPGQMKIAPSLEEFLELKEES